VCLQSGSDRILRRMKRRWGAKRFVDRCHLIRQRLDNPALTTDIIVGFPGETEEDFADTCRVSREVGFSKIHIFPFSPRRTTPAAEMSEQVPGDVKADRVHRLAEIEAELRQQYFQSLVGRELHVLLEGEAETEQQADGTQTSAVFTGTTCRYAPLELSVAGQAAQELKPGTIVAVTPTGVANDRLIASIAGA